MTLHWNRQNYDMIVLCNISLKEVKVGDGGGMSALIIERGKLLE